jgi:hypothetical protein
MSMPRVFEGPRCPMLLPELQARIALTCVADRLDLVHVVMVEQRVKPAGGEGERNEAIAPV